MKTLHLVVAIATLSIATRLLGQNYSIDWSTIGGGGGMGASGNYSLHGTIGQYGASEPATAGTYSVVGGFWAVLSATASTNTAVEGILRFTNANPAILNLLNAPGNEGMQSFSITAVSQPPAPAVTATTAELPAASRVSTPYSITVNPAAGGTAYAVTPRVALLGGSQTYYFNSRTSPVVLTSGPPAALDFEECLGIATVRFVDTAGNPTPVDGGQILVTGTATRRHSIPTGATEASIYLRGGATHALGITVNRGTDFYRDRLTFVLNTNVTVVCDAFTSIAMLVPETGALGRIAGQVDMLGEFELTVDGSDAANIPDSTGLIAFNGPFQNQRWAALTGTHFTVPSSGAYVLSNVAPSTLSPASLGYAVYAQMYFRTNREIQSFRSPALGVGSNAPLPVAAGQSVNLSNLFVINPGYLRGNLRLQGPSESSGRESQFRGLSHASDNDANHDGVPDQLGGFGVYGSSVRAEGVNRRAPGATYTAAYGFAIGDFQGDFFPSNSRFDGSFELVLGGLNSQPSLWSPKYLNLLMAHPAGLNASNYYSCSLALTDRRNPEVQIIPDMVATQDVAYCFSEVRLAIRSSTGYFHSPEVRASSGSFTGTDFNNQPADYTVALSVASGTPNHAADAANRGEVVMYLPQGTYRLFPSVVFSGAGSGRTGLGAVDLTIGCQQRLSLDGCLRVEVPVTSFAQSGSTAVPVLVLGCSNQVTRITYQLNGGPTVTACNGCGILPALNLNLNLLSGINTLLVTATDSQGSETSLETLLHTPTTSPRLTIIRDSGGSGSGALRISWPASALGFSLQRSPDASPGSWSAVAEQVQSNGPNQFITILSPTSKQFYRLLKP